jgi:hypothetical protein
LRVRARIPRHTVSVDDRDKVEVIEPASLREDIER